MKKLLIDYNLEATEIEKLEGYDSINYRIKTNSDQYVLKHYLNASEYGLIHAEVQLLNEISNQLTFQIPITVNPLITLNNKSFTRLLSYIKGDFLAQAEQNKILLFNFGKAIAQLDKTLLSKKSYPIEARKQVWDLQFCLLNSVKINHIKDASKRKLVHYFFDQFEHHVLPKQDLLRYSIIHGDLNENNVLVEKNEIIGFIGHSYYLNSPATSSDIIRVINFDSAPGSPERPLGHRMLNFWEMPVGYPDVSE